MRHLVCISLGSNIDPKHNIPKAIEHLCQFVEILAVSSAWENPAIGSEGPDFINAAVLVQTNLSARELSDKVLKPIEAQMGRVRTEDKYSPRTIDLDILVYDQQVIDPQIFQYAFLALPAGEVLPDFIVGEQQERLSQIGLRLAMGTQIQRRPEILPGNSKSPG